jgi:hypothetical protein
VGIDVKRETEFGEQESVVLDPRALMPALLSRCRDRQWRLIQYIDPYGNTVFNQLQIPELLDELNALRAFAGSEDEQTFLGAVIDLIEGTKNQVHTYVRFFGD